MSSGFGRSPGLYIREKMDRNIISESDGMLILKFITQMTAEQGLKPRTAAGDTRFLAKLVENVPDIKSWDYEKLLNYVAMVREKYKPNTSRKDIFMVKHFGLWLLNQGIVSGVTKEQLKSIIPSQPDRMTKTADDMITPEEFQKILMSTKTSRDRAIISVLFESAMRPSELLSMTWSDIKTDVNGAIINTAGKTGKPRYIRLIRSAEFLKIWKNDYPEPIRKDSPVFVNLDRKPHHSITNGGLKRILVKSASCLTDKKIHPYLFRHSRITEMLSKGIPESVIKMQAWGSLTSPMLATYGHLSNDQQDTFLLAAEGVANKKPKNESMFKPKVCPCCAAENLNSMEFCGVCGATLDPEKYQLEMDMKAREVESLKEQMAVLSELVESLMSSNDRPVTHGKFVLDQWRAAMPKTKVSVKK
jgi:integrase